MFKFEGDGTGSYRIIARHSGLSFDVWDRRLEGGSVRTAGNGGQDNRQFFVIPASSIASHSYKRDHQPMPAADAELLRKLAGAKRLTAHLSVPISAGETSGIALSVTDIAFTDQELTLARSPPGRPR